MNLYYTLELICKEKKKKFPYLKTNKQTKKYVAENIQRSHFIIGNNIFRCLWKCLFFFSLVNKH